jgi:hypothetical protein
MSERNTSIPGTSALKFISTNSLISGGSDGA